MKPLRLIILCMIIAAESCSQNYNRMSDSKSKKHFLEIDKLVERFDYEPRTILDFSSKSCTYQVLINDIPALNSNEEGDINGAILPISDLILKSGKQTITIRMFPPKNKNYSPDEFLNKNSGIHTKIMIGDYSRQNPTEFEVVCDFRTPEIVADNLPYIEMKREFDMVVPYQLKGWTNGILLVGEDWNKLTSEIYAYYERYREWKQNRMVDNILNALYNRQLENSQAFFINTKEKNKAIEDRVSDMEINILKMNPIENCEISFFGDGKVVALVRTDPEFARASALIGKTERFIRILPIYLYRPKPGAPLEIIR